uniref:Uncharacterized protein n=1 Tax=viral metagenome TaxID=1070528 RepID=A0A6C0F421_9ZZZZ
MKLWSMMVNVCALAAGRFWDRLSMKEPNGESTAILKTTPLVQGRSRANSFLTHHTDL